MTRETLRQKLAGHGEDFPFLGLCIVAGVAAVVFLTVLFIDAYKQWKKREPMRRAAKKRAQVLNAKAEESP
jgi:hypothetical protein